jgi:mutator protein MutT
MIKHTFWLTSILAVFIFYIVMQNYQPTNKQSVAVAIVQKNNQLLIAKRAKQDEFFNKWSFLGGKVEAGETLHECLKRELKEELNIDAEIGKYLGTQNFYSKDKHYELHFFLVHHFNGQIKLNHEHTEFAWVKQNELKQYDMLNSDLPLEALLERA